jgi:hypothetical protein
MDTITYIRSDIAWAHELLEMVMADATQEQVDWVPPGIANPLGATYAHAVCAEDAVINSLLRDGPPMFAGEWAGRTGISEPAFGASFDWARGLEVQLPQAREYAQAVYRSTDEFLAGLEEGELDQELDLTAHGFGKRMVSWVLSALLISHLNNMAGEISALKGLQGAKGYPF